MSIIKEMIDFDKILDEEEAILNADSEETPEQEEDLEIDQLSRSLTPQPSDNDDIQTAFHVMRELMHKFKDFCDSCEGAWKVQEIPAALRQRLISIDQHNQDKYQKLYMLIQRYAEEMRKAYIRNPDDSI